MVNLLCEAGSPFIAPLDDDHAHACTTVTLINFPTTQRMTVKYKATCLHLRKRSLGRACSIETTPNRGLLIIFVCQKCGKQDVRAPWVLRKCRAKYGMNLCRACQRAIEPRVKRPKLKVDGSNKTSTELRE